MANNYSVELCVSGCKSDLDEIEKIFTDNLNVDRNWSAWYMVGLAIEAMGFDPETVEDRRAYTDNVSRIDDEDLVMLPKRLKGRERRFATIVNHRISKRLVAKAKGEHRGIAIEDLKNIRWGMNSKKRNKTFRRRSNSWNFYQLRSFLEYKCKMAGINIVAIPPAYTSQTCHECGHIGIRNGKHFCCTHCGNVADADVNAALNIATWGYVNTHERWELLSCPIHDDYSTSKAHKSLACG